MLEFLKNQKLKISETKYVLTADNNVLLRIKISSKKMIEIKQILRNKRFKTYT